jgi:hypothetical protein
MRTIVRGVGKPLPEGQASARMVKRMAEAIEVLTDAKESKLTHVSLSDPDARMMPIGAKKGFGMGHMFEVAADSGMIVAGGSNNSPTDTGHLKPLLEQAQKNDPVLVTQVLADSGYYEGGTIVELQSAGLEVVVPDATTAGSMRRGFPEPPVEPVEFTKIEGRNAYCCPQGNVLTQKNRWESGGQTFRQYKATKLCTGCPLADRCLSKPTNKYRSFRVQQYGSQLREYLDKFKDPDIRSLYYSRGPKVETIFGGVRTTQKFIRWSVRGDEAVASEAELLKLSYQARKLHKGLGGAQFKAA